MTANVMVPKAITRDANHVYTYQGKRYPSVTTILKVLDKSGPLMAWAARQTAEAAIGMMTGPDPMYWPLATLQQTVGNEGVIKALTERSKWTRDTAAQLGTDVHALADDHVNGRPLKEGLPEPILERVRAYAEWWQGCGWALRSSEAMVCHPVFGFGGTLDLLARDRDGRTVLADIKTGKAVYTEAVLQLTAYGMAEVIQTDAGLFTMPQIDRYVVLHVTPTGVREVELSVGTLERIAFGACIDLHQWAESMKGKKL